MTIAELQYYANLYSMTEQGAWLNQFDWRKTHLFIVDGPGLGSRWPGGIILVDPQTAGQVQFGTYIHELRHQWQHKQQGFLKYAIMNLFKRNQPDAEQQFDKATLWLINDSLYFEEKYKGKTV